MVSSVGATASTDGCVGAGKYFQNCIRWKKKEKKNCPCFAIVEKKEKKLSSNDGKIIVLLWSPVWVPLLTLWL